MRTEPSSDMLTAADWLAETFSRTWNERDGVGYGEAYWPDAELVDPTGTIWYGREAISRMHVELWKGPARDTVVAATVRRVRPIAETAMVVDLAVEVKGFSPPPPGARSGPDGAISARLKHVVEKRGETWKIAASQNTFVAAMGA